MVMKSRDREAMTGGGHGPLFTCGVSPVNSRRESDGSWKPFTYYLKNWCFSSKAQTAVAYFL